MRIPINLRWKSTRSGILCASLLVSLCSILIPITHAQEIYEDLHLWFDETSDCHPNPVYPDTVSGSFAVMLRWSPPSLPFCTYKVYRDGVCIYAGSAPSCYVISGSGGFNDCEGFVAWAEGQKALYYYGRTIRVEASRGCLSLPSIVDEVAVKNPGALLGQPDTVPEAGDPVSTLTGNLHYRHMDLLVPGSRGMPLAFERVYNSQASSGGVLGHRWTHSYGMKIETNANDVVVTYGDGRRVLFTNDNGTYVSKYKDTYDTVERLPDQTWRLKTKSRDRHEFSEAGNLMKIADRNGNETTLAYNSSTNLASVTDPVGRQLQFAYDAQRRITSVTDSSGRSVIYTYDGDGDLVTFTNAASNSTTYVYDNHRLTRIIGPEGKTILESQYTNFCPPLVAYQLDGESNRTSFAYDRASRTTYVTNANDNVSAYEFDSQGRIVRETDAVSNDVTYAYNSNNEITCVTNRDGAVWRYEYDSRGNLTKSIDPLLAETVLCYDEDNDLVSLTNALGHATHFTYDGNGNLIRTAYADGTETEYRYDDHGQPTNVVDAAGKVVVLGYDAEGNAVSAADAEGDTVVYDHDDLGRRTCKTDPQGNATHFEYDPLNRLSRTTDPAGGQVNMTNNVAGLGSLTDQNGNTTIFCYDDLNRLESIVDPLGNTNRFRYDGNGNLIFRTDCNRDTISNAYDQADRLVAVHYPDGSQVSFDYDPAGRLIRCVDQTGTSSYSYDALGRLTAYTNGFGHAVSYAYDEIGNLRTITYPGSRTVTYEYDELNRLVRMEDWAGRQTTCSYNTNGLVDLVVLPNGAKALYQYDDVGRMIGLQNVRSNNSVISSCSYTYDKNGDIVSSTMDQPIPLVLQSEVVDYTNGTDNRILSANAVSMAYDRNGNMLTNGAAVYRYDYENRLTNAVTAGGTWKYVYDGLGRRLAARHDAAERRFLLDPRGMTHVLGEYDGDNNLVAFYVYGLGLTYKVDAADGAYCYHYDYTGHTVAMTDSNSVIVNAYAYSAYGETLMIQETVPNAFRYVGKLGVMDDGNGLLYMRARYYSPEIGRFITDDAILFYGGVHQYSYADDDPVDRVDPAGFCGQKLASAREAMTKLLASWWPRIKLFWEMTHEDAMGALGHSPIPVSAPQAIGNAVGAAEIERLNGEALKAICEGDVVKAQEFVDRKQKVAEQVKQASPFSLW